MSEILAISILLLALHSHTIAQLPGCAFPIVIRESRLNRLHHPCEQNRDEFFAIETSVEENFYCLFYSSFLTFLTQSDERMELTIDSGEFEVQQSGAVDFTVNSTRISFTLSLENVIVKVSGKHNLPRISSAVVNGAEYCERQHCGVRSEAIPVIIGGSMVREGAWPWHAAVFYRPAVDVLRFRCGSTIVNGRTVITTATCAVTYDASLQQRVAIAAEMLSIGVGVTTLHDSSAARRRMIQIDDIRLHPMFTSEEPVSGFGDDYNVALLILSESIEYSPHVQPICLPSLTDDDEFDYDGRVGKVVGWGFTGDGELEISQQLQDMTVPTYNYLTCLFRALNRTFFHGYSARRNFCAGYAVDRGICTGDSGGGLYMEEDSRFYIYGLASSANCECIQETGRCTIKSEGIFVNLIEFMQWIHNNMY